jgi:hypothetical protein
MENRAKTIQQGHTPITPEAWNSTTVSLHKQTNLSTHYNQKTLTHGSTTRKNIPLKTRSREIQTH